MSVKSKKRKQDRLEPKVAAWYCGTYHKWLDREPTTANPVLHGKWEAAEPVKPKWLKEYEEKINE